MEEVDEFRSRSNTWPMRRICDSEAGQFTSSDENNGNEHSANLSSNDSAIGLSGESIATHQITSLEPVTCVVASKKVSSRRNAWGNASYAELITQAINSSSEKRLTLSQIYEWMVHNVPYFKDKGDSNSSAGWKNSIRHNLSLHSRFMRIQNEGTGKSSWWMINPEGKPGKAPNRRRAASMETSKFEKKRGRARRKLETVRAGIKFETASPSSSISEGLDTFPESPPIHPTGHFSLSPEAFRPRASSNASSCGRLSPIPCEPDTVSNSPLSPLTWTPAELAQPQRPQAHYSGEQQQPYADQLAEMTFHSMNLEGNNSPIDNTAYFTRTTTDESDDCNQVSPASSQSTLTSLNFAFGSDISVNSGIVTNGVTSKSLVSNDNDAFIERSSNIDTSNINLTPLNKSSSTNTSSTARDLPCDNLTVNVHSMSNSAQSMDTHAGHLNSSFISSRYEPIQRKRALTYSFGPARHRDTNNLLNSQSVSQVFGQLFSINNSLPNDLDLESIQGGLECDVNSVIQHELSVEGNLDFNFDPLNSVKNRSSTPVNTSMSGMHSHSCVH